MTSQAERFRSLPESSRQEFLAGLNGEELEALRYAWPFWARADQLPPDNDSWRGFLLLGGRGAGKTRSLVEWARADLQPHDRVAIVGRTAADVRDVLIEGESGLLAVCPPWDTPVYEPTKRKVTFPNGATCHLYSSQEPDVLRGPQHSKAIADEIATWDSTATWTNLMLGLRLGDNPRWAAATTPRPVRLLKDLMADPTVIVRRSSTYANSANLPPAFLDQIISRYEGTSTGRAELLGEFVDEVEGALWTRTLCDSCLLPAAPEDLTRIIVGVDPAATSGESADSTGIVVCGRDSEGRYYVLADRTLRATPKGWAEAAIKVYREFKADRIVCEKNAGGEMCEAVIRQVDPSVSLKLVHASRGKRVRAEPVAAVFEQHRAYFCGDFPDLIDELCTWTVDDPQSPDRLDAMTWAMSELLDTRRSGFAIVGGPIIWGGTEMTASAPASAWPPPGRAAVTRTWIGKPPY